MAEPVAPSSAPSPTTPAPAGGGPSPSSAGPSTPPQSEPFKAPADEWQSKATEYENKLKAWDGVGDPAQVRQTLDFARSVVAALQSGQSAVFDPETGKVLFKAPTATAPTTPTDPFDGIDDLPPREQAARLRDIVKAELAGSVKSDVEQVKALIQDQLKNLGGQQKLFMTAARLAQTHPDVPFEQLVAKATELSAQTPEQLLESALQSMLSPKEQERLIAQKVEEAKAQWQQEQDNQDAQLLAPKTGPFMARMMNAEQAAKDQNPIERKNKNRLELIRKIREISRKAG